MKCCLCNHSLSHSHVVSFNHLIHSHATHSHSSYPLIHSFIPSYSHPPSPDSHILSHLSLYFLLYKTSLNLFFILFSSLLHSLLLSFTRSSFLFLISQSSILLSFILNFILFCFRHVRFTMSLFSPDSFYHLSLLL